MPCSPIPLLNHMGSLLYGPKMQGLSPVVLIVLIHQDSLQGKNYYHVYLT